MTAAVVSSRPTRQEVHHPVQNARGKARQPRHNTQRPVLRPALFHTISTRSYPWCPCKPPTPV